MTTVLSPVDVIVPGRFGAAINADRAGIEVAWNEAMLKPPFTIEIRAKPRRMEACDVLVAFGRPSTAEHVQIQVLRDGRLSVEMHGRSPWTFIADDTFEDDAWHLYAMSFDDHQIRLAVDGKLVGERAMTVSPKPSGKGSLFIGTNPDPASGQASQALIEEVRISSSVRKLDVSTEHSLEVDDDTVALWRISDLEGNHVPDRSGHCFDGRLRTTELDVSLDDLDAAAFAAGPSPMHAPLRRVQTSSHFPSVIRTEDLSLDGLWQMAEGGSPTQRLNGDWNDAVSAQVPGSVHSALEAASLIPDSKVGRNDAIAREQSFRTWWFRKTFIRPPGEGHRLIFGGVAIRCTVWLNGRLLGNHEGMFGGPEFDVAHLLEEENELVVRIDPAPRGHEWFWDSNDGWRKTVVFNCVYGWHYSDIPSLGIWRTVRIEASPTVRMIHPFVATLDPGEGRVAVRVDLQSDVPSIRGRLTGLIEPENFQGASTSFAIDVDVASANEAVRFDLKVPDPQLWWPNGIGKPNLYRLRLSFQPSDGTPHEFVTTFGVRTIEMRPQPDGPHPKRYNWIFAINGRPMFVKGTGWCTLDPCMDFRRERYERFLTMAHQEHCQMVRAWGGGMPETDDFYDVCDRLGLMVMQEWPTAWNSHHVQPIEMLEETVRVNTLRLRNRASLVMWGAGNESNDPQGPAIDMMGRLAVELDGMRPFHRGEAWGGSEHNYGCWWDEKHLDHNLNMTSRFWGEFGIASLPVYESVQRYLPDSEKHLWPPPGCGSFAHHTPVFNRAGEMDRLRQYSGYFTSGETMERFITGSQLSQAVGVRHTLERSRTRYPNCSGALLYKLNDNYPAASWSTVDWYGAAKIAHWFVKSAFQPLHACVLFESLNNVGRDLSLPVFLLDDADALEGSSWRVHVRAFDASLDEIASKVFSGRDSIAGVIELGKFELTAAQTNSSPLFVVVDTFRDGERLDRNYYFVNYETKRDCLFELPTTTLRNEMIGNIVRLHNTSNKPAVGTAVYSPGHLDTFAVSDNYIWIDPGETTEVIVNVPAGVTAGAWNVTIVDLFEGR